MATPLKVTTLYANPSSDGKSLFVHFASVGKGRRYRPVLQLDTEAAAILMKHLQRATRKARKAA